MEALSIKLHCTAHNLTPLLVRLDVTFFRFKDHLSYSLSEKSASSPPVLVTTKISGRYF